LLAAQLRSRLGVPVVSLEDLYGGWDGLENGIDLLVSEVLGPLAAGRTARVPRYDWITRRWAEPVLLDPPTSLIVEGVGAGARRAAVFASLVVWLEAPPLVRKKRALDRDGETFAPHWDQWAAQEDAMLARERTPERADLVLDAAPGELPGKILRPPTALAHICDGDDACISPPSRAPRRKHWPAGCHAAFWARCAGGPNLSGRMRRWPSSWPAQGRAVSDARGAVPG
jgi:hypothetical protein